MGHHNYNEIATLTTDEAQIMLQLQEGKSNLVQEGHGGTLVGDGGGDGDELAALDLALAAHAADERRVRGGRRG